MCLVRAPGLEPKSGIRWGVRAPEGVGTAVPGGYPEGIIAVCCAYPDGYYQDAVTVADICDGSDDPSLTEEGNVPISRDCCSI